MIDVSGRPAGPADRSNGAARQLLDRFGGLMLYCAMEIADVARRAQGLSGVRHTTRDGLAEWRYHGRLVLRQLDDAHVVIRADFDYRDSILRQFPGTFSVPPRFVKHMMVVADLATGDAGAIEDAIEAAWQLQRSAQPGSPRDFDGR